MIAAAIAERQVTPLQFTMEKIMDPTIRAQLKKVVVVADPEIEKVFPALQRVIVHITTNDGRYIQQTTRLSQGRSAQSADRSGNRREVRGARRAGDVEAGAAETERCDLESGEARSVSELMELMKADSEAKSQEQLATANDCGDETPSPSTGAQLGSKDWRRGN